MQDFPSPETVNGLRANLTGQRIRFIRHLQPEPQPLEPGAEGTVRDVDDGGIIHVDWDSGRGLGLAWDGDEYEVV